jgi:hypothetical protein
VFVAVEADGDGRARDTAIASCTSTVGVDVERGRLGALAQRWPVWPLLAVLVLGVAGCGGGGAGGSVGAEESRVSSESGEVRCGRRFQLPGVARLRLVALFAESVPAGQQTLSGTVEVTSQKAMRGVAPAAADVFLVRDDRVVTTPVAQDAIGIRWELAAGETRTMPALASLVSCEPDGGPLPRGDYELYARVVVSPDDGAAQRAFGGPWRLRVR